MTETILDTPTTEPKRTPARPTVAVPAWPDLPAMVQELLADIESEDGEQAPGVRPWDLALLPEEAREPVSEWLHDVVVWLNNTYAWQPRTIIPPCWHRHPHLAMELAVIAFGRLLAYQTQTTTHPSRWHDDLQTFYQRLETALGDGASDCRGGRHRGSPAALDLALYG